MSIVHVAFYPSDWLAGTRGLIEEETGVYITLVARIYEMAGPIERDDERLSRLCGCKTRARFVKALDHLISEGKIVQTPDGLTNERAEKEIKNTTEKSEKAKQAAESRWSKKPNKNNAGNNANAMRTHRPSICQSEPEPYLESSSNEELPISPQPEAVHANDISEAVSAYNAAAERAGWPKVQKLTPARAKSLRARLLDAGGLPGWRGALDRAYASDFCREGWRGFGFDSLVSQQKFTRLMEGNYDNRTGSARYPDANSTARQIAFAARAGRAPSSDCF
jgi:uncharacterized protein YdaU (DUF1376 family)